MLTWIVALALASTPRPGIVIEVDPCLELDAEELELVNETVELCLGAGPEYLEASAAQSDDTLVLLDCGSAGEAVIRLVDPLTQTSVTRALELPARPRRAEQLQSHSSKSS